MKAVVIHSPLDLRVDDIAELDMSETDVRVRIDVGGICGSDLHYYRHGGFGATRIREPMVLGHEIAGTVVEVGSSVKNLRIGQTVAVNPSHPCGVCSYCRSGRHNLCTDMRFYGSAMRFPHVQGGFRQFLVCHATQAIAVPDGVEAWKAAFAEPLAVCLHAVNQAGAIFGQRVLVTGSGPIGVLTAMAARLAGARDVTITDIVDPPLEIARAAGIDLAVNVASQPDLLAPESYDIMFEAAGSPKTVQDGLNLVRRGGTLVQIGQGAEATLQMSQIVTREITLRGAFRFDPEFDLAVELIASGRLDLSPLRTATFHVDEAREAFEIASDKMRSMKVQLVFQ